MDEYDRNDRCYRNYIIKNAIHSLLNAKDDERHSRFIGLMSIIAERICENGEVIVPFVDVKDALINMINPDTVSVGDTICLDEEVRLKMDTVTDGSGRLWYPIFTDRDELEKGAVSNVIMLVSMKDMLCNGLKCETVEGVVFNPFGEAFVMDKRMIEALFKDFEALGI